MNELPPLVQRAPSILYGAAGLFFLWSLGLTIGETNITMAGAEPGNPVVRLSMLRGLYQAALEAVYIAANGVVAHILIAIWRNGARPKRGGSE